MAAEHWSLPVRGAWIEIANQPVTPPSDWSLPVRGAWIEIKDTDLDGVMEAVAPRTGSVD